MERVDPPRAKTLLEGNLGNRSLSEGHVDGLARDMAAGRWVFNAQPIIIATSGRILDGQHRLEAVVKSGATIDCFIAWDIPENAMESIDRNRARTVADLLRINTKMSNSMNVAAVVRVIGMLETGAPESRASKRLTYGEVQGIYTQYAKDVQWALETIGYKIEPNIPSGGAYVMGPLAFMRGAFPTKIDAFTERVTTGNITREGDPAAALRKAIGTMGGKGQHERKTLAPRTLRCIEAELSGEPLHVAKVDAGIFERALIARQAKRRQVRA